MSALRTFLVAVIAVAVTGCGLADALKPKTALTPARQLEGTWKTAIPVTVYYQSDFCSGQRETFAQSRWDVTWTITAVPGYENVLDIEMRITKTNPTPIASSCGNDGSGGYGGLPSLSFLEATVSGALITAYDTNSDISVPGSFTTDLMMLTWKHYECIIYCQGEFTKDQEFKLVRQR